MAVRFSCPDCAKEFETPEEMAGKKIKCRGCGTIMVVPGGPALEPEPVSRRERRREAPAPRSSGGGVLKVLLIFTLFGGLFACLICGGGGAIYYFGFYARGPSSAELAYMPDDCTNFMQLDLDTIMRSPAYAEIQQKCPNSMNRLRFARTPGGKQRDATKAVIGRAGSAQIVVLTMRQSLTIEELIDDGARFQESSVAGKNVYLSAGTTYYIDGKTVVAGDDRAVRAVLERKGPPRLSESMKNAMSEADFSQPQVAIMDFKEFGGPMFQNMPAGGPEMPLALVADGDFKLPMNRRAKLIYRDAASAARAKELAEREGKKVAGPGLINASISVRGSVLTIRGTVTDACAMVAGMGW